MEDIDSMETGHLHELCCVRAGVLPDGAVFVGSAEKSGNTYVGRNKQGEAGKVTLENLVAPKKTDTDPTSPTVPDVLKVAQLCRTHKIWTRQLSVLFVALLMVCPVLLFLLCPCFCGCLFLAGAVSLSTCVFSARRLHSGMSLGGTEWHVRLETNTF